MSVCKFKIHLNTNKVHVVPQILIALDALSFNSYHEWCWSYYLVVNTITLTLIVDRTYEFIHGMTIQILTYLTNAQMGIAFAESYAMCKVI